MKKMLSNWSGRLISLLFPAALVASFLVPANVSAVVGISLGGGGGGSEGDPLDTNDYGSGGGGGSHDDQNQDDYNPVPGSFGFEFDRFQILLIPQFVEGIPTFKIIVVENTDLNLTDWSLERTNAP